MLICRSKSRVSSHLHQGETQHQLSSRETVNTGEFSWSQQVRPDHSSTKPISSGSNMAGMGPVWQIKQHTTLKFLISSLKISIYSRLVVGLPHGFIPIFSWELTQFGSHPHCFCPCCWRIISQTLVKISWEVPRVVLNGETGTAGHIFPGHR